MAAKEALDLRRARLWPKPTPRVGASILVARSARISWNGRNSPSVPICELHGLVITRDRSVLRRRSIGQIEHDFVQVTPSPPLWRVVALDDGMAGRMEMLGCVSVR